LERLENCTGTGLNLFVFGENLYMRNISEKNRCLQVAHEQRNFMGHSIPTQPVLPWPWAPSQILLTIAPHVPSWTTCAQLEAMKNPQASDQNSKRFRFYSLSNCNGHNPFLPSSITVFILKGVWKPTTSFLYKI